MILAHNKKYASKWGFESPFIKKNVDHSGNERDWKTLSKMKLVGPIWFSGDDGLKI